MIDDRFHLGDVVLRASEFADAGEVREPLRGLFASGRRRLIDERRPDSLDLKGFAARGFSRHLIKVREPGSVFRLGTAASRPREPCLAFPVEQSCQPFGSADAFRSRLETKRRTQPKQR